MSLLLTSLVLFAISSVSIYARLSSSIKFSRLSFRFHFPRRSNPRWLTITLTDYDYIDSTCHVSTPRILITLWLFPLLFNHTAGPWCSVELHDFRLRVFSSTTTPLWVQRLRKNLVSTVLTGNVLRIDDFVTTLETSSFTTAYTPSDDAPQDEGRVSATLQQYHVRNAQGRVYTFGKLDAQLRRNWLDHRGEFVMIAEESRWSKVLDHSDTQSAPSFTPWHIFTAILVFPFDLLRIYHDPMSAVDLYVPLANITFATFRTRDAELFRQVGAILKERYARNKSIFDGFLWDAIMAAVLSFTK